MGLKINNKNCHIDLPEEVSKECFLYEAISYMAFEYAPINPYYHFMYCDEEDVRHAEYLYCNEIDITNICNNELINNLLNQKFQIEDPYFDPKYDDVNYRNSIKEYDDFYARIFDAIKDDEKELEKFKRERKLMLEYSDKKEIYDAKVEEILIPYKIELLNLLRSGKVYAYGFLVQKYSMEEGEFIDIDEDWIDKAATKKFDEDVFIKRKPRYNEDEIIHRVSIPKEYWKIENIDFEESQLILNIASDTFRYTFILIDFLQLHKIINNDLVYTSEAEIRRSGITYKRDQYINLKDAESIKNKKYINEKIKGGKSSHKRNHALKKIVQEFCEKELKIKNYSSANGLCQAIAEQVRNSRIDLLSEFLPYQVHIQDGGLWTNGTFYNWCNAVYKNNKSF